MRFVPLAAVAVIAATTLSVNALGQGTDTTQPRGSSVGDGNGAAPAISSTVRLSVERAGCRVRAFKSEGRLHGLGSLTYKQVPAVSGTHNGRWADWGVYDEVVKPQYQVHNLEHGGVVVSFGLRLGDEGAEGLAALFLREPGYLVMTPRAAKGLKPAEPKLGLRGFPERGFVATSWQRRLVCKTTTTKTLRALTAFTRAYRGKGPEAAPAVNSTTEPPADLPSPSEPAPAPGA